MKKDDLLKGTNVFKIHKRKSYFTINQKLLHSCSSSGISSPPMTLNV